MSEKNKDRANGKAAKLRPNTAAQVCRHPAAHKVAMAEVHNLRTKDLRELLVCKHKVTVAQASDIVRQCRIKSGLRKRNIKKAFRGHSAAKPSHNLG